MSPESWQTICPRCGWANSGAERKCMKCGQPLRTSPGLLVAGQSAGSAIAPQAIRAKQVVQPGGFFPRLIAQIVDGLILGVIVVPVIYLWVGQPKNQTSAAAQGNFATDLVRNTVGAAVAHYSNDQLTQLIGLVGGLLILSLFYYAGTWSILGGSPGQLLMNLRVVDRDARSLGFGALCTAPPTHGSYRATDDTDPRPRSGLVRLRRLFGPLRRARAIAARRPTGNVDAGAARVPGHSAR